MGIFGYLKEKASKLFNKDEGISSFELINIRDSINIRTMDELDSIERIQLEEYKNDYLERLKNRVLFSGDLDTNDFKKEMDMYLELLSNLFLKENSAFESVDDYNEKLDLMVKIKKRNLYLKSIIEINRNIELRIIALEEILKSINSFSIRKKRIIIDKINSLVVLLNVFKTQGEAIYLDATANIKTAENLEDDAIVLMEDAKKRRDLLERMFKLMMPDRHQFYKSKYFTSIYDEIAYLERELEIGVYEHKDVINNIEEYLDRFDNIAIEDLQEIELRIRVFSDFGRNLVSDELLKKLYRIKFRLITKDILHSYNSEWFENLSYIEIEQYSEIIFEKISDILKDDVSYKLDGNYNYLRILLGDDYGKYVKLISKVLKDGEGAYNWYKILTSRLLLSFLLSLENIEDIFEFFRCIKDDRMKYGDEKAYEENIFTWEDELPLETIFDVLPDLEIPLAKLYRKLFVPMREKNSSDDIYQIPEGIVSINCPNGKTGPLLESIRSSSESKIVYTPSSLKSIYGDIFGGRQFRRLELNEGLEDFLNFPVNNYNYFYTFNVPSTLKRVAQTAWSEEEIDKHSKNSLYVYFHHLTNPIYRSIRTLVFKNFDFNNPSDAVKYILSNFFVATFDQCLDTEYVNLSDTHPDTPYNLKRVETSLQFIIFEGKNGERVELGLKEINNLAVTRNHLYLSKILLYEEIPNLLNYLLTEALAYKNGVKGKKTQKQLIMK